MENPDRLVTSNEAAKRLTSPPDRKLIKAMLSKLGIPTYRVGVAIAFDEVHLPQIAAAVADWKNRPTLLGVPRKRRSRAKDAAV